MATNRILNFIPTLVGIMIGVIIGLAINTLLPISGPQLRTHIGPEAPDELDELTPKSACFDTGSDQGNKTQLGSEAVEIRKIAEAKSVQEITELFASLPAWKQYLSLDKVFRIEQTQGAKSLVAWIDSLALDRSNDDTMTDLILDQLIASSPGSRPNMEWIAQWVKKVQHLGSHPPEGEGYSGYLLHNVLARWITEDRYKAIHWLGKQPDWLKSAHATEFVAELAKVNVADAINFVESALPGLAHDSGVEGLLDSGQLPDEERKLWVKSITDEGIKMRIRQEDELRSLGEEQRRRILDEDRKEAMGTAKVEIETETGN